MPDKLRGYKSYNAIRFDEFFPERSQRLDGDSARGLLLVVLHEHSARARTKLETTFANDHNCDR